MSPAAQGAPCTLPAARNSRQGQHHNPHEEYGRGKPQYPTQEAR